MTGSSKMRSHSSSRSSGLSVKLQDPVSQTMVEDADDVCSPSKLGVQETDRPKETSSIVCFAEYRLDDGQQKLRIEKR